MRADLRRGPACQVPVDCERAAIHRPWGPGGHLISRSHLTSDFRTIHMSIGLPSVIESTDFGTLRGALGHLPDGVQDDDQEYSSLLRIGPIIFEGCLYI